MKEDADRKCLRSVRSLGIEFKEFDGERQVSKRLPYQKGLGECQD